MAILLLAINIPNCDGSEDADTVADEITEIINEERARNNKEQGPSGRVTVHMWPSPQFVSAAQIKDLMNATGNAHPTRSGFGHRLWRWFQTGGWSEITDSR